MMKFELTLRYLAEKSGIPVWVMGEKGLLACGVKEEYLADESVRARFLAEVASGCTEGVQVRKLSSGELYACFSAEAGVYIAGPSYELHPLIGGKRGSAGILFAPAHVKAALLMMPAVSAAEFCRFVSVLSEVVRGESFDPAALEGETGSEEKYLLLFAGEKPVFESFVLSYAGGDTFSAISTTSVGAIASRPVVSFSRSAIVS